MTFDIKKELQKIEVEEIKKLVGSLEIKEATDVEDSYKFTVKISSESVDRDGEVLKADGADFKWYKKNPIVLLNHWYSVENIIGKATKVWQEGTDTFAEGYFSKTNPKAKIAMDLYNEWMLKTVSVWFIVKERDPNDRNTITKWEMLEFSFVAVQSNRDAMSLDEKSLEIYKKWIENWIFLETKAKEVKIETKIHELGEKIDTLTDLFTKFADDKATKEKQAIESAKKLKKETQSLASSLSAHLAKMKNL